MADGSGRQLHPGITKGEFSNDVRPNNHAKTPKGAEFYYKGLYYKIGVHHKAFWWDSVLQKWILSMEMSDELLSKIGDKLKY